MCYGELKRNQSLIYKENLLKSMANSEKGKSNKKINDDYYSILEIDKSCKKSDIDTAYRRLAIRWHPDKNKDNRELAEKKFREITKAYQVLSDVDARTAYDKTGNASNSVNIIDPYELFKGMFDNEDNQIPDVVLSVTADIEKLYTGFTESINFTRFSVCEKCDGTGTKSKKISDCQNCSGRGVLMETVTGGKVGYMINEKKCDECEGNGIDPGAKLCKECSGNKYVKEDIECDVDVPPGAYDNYYIKLENEGNYIPPDEKRSKKDRKTKRDRTDVIVVIKEKIDKKSNIHRGMFIQEIGRINLADVLMTVPVTFAESIAGIKKEIDYLGGRTIGIEINDIVQNGDIKVIEDSGMPLVPEELEKLTGRNKTDIKKRGDLFIMFKVEKPELNSQQRRRLWQIITDTAYPEDTEIDNDIMRKTIDFRDYVDNEKKKIPIKESQKEDSDESSISQDDDNDSDESKDDSESDESTSDNDRSSKPPHK
jgi:molecular chaperone DnaJ